MKKINYMPPIFNYFCTYMLCISLLIDNSTLNLILGALWLISLLCCCIETIFIIIPHMIKNKRIHIREKMHWIIEIFIFNPALVVSYTSDYIYKEKKDSLITNLSTLICIIGYLLLLYIAKIKGFI